MNSQLTINLTAEPCILVQLPAPLRKHIATTARLFGYALSDDVWKALEAHE